MRKQEKEDFQKRLLACWKEYEQVKARIKEVGFICEGSLVERRLPCGNPNCHCHKDRKNLHGPYYQLSWKEKGKTVSRYLSPEEACLYREWIDNRRRLAAIKNEMLAISRRARGCLLTMENKGTRDTEKNKGGRKR